MKTFFRSMSVVCLMLATGCGLDGPIPSGPKCSPRAAAEPNSRRSIPRATEASESTADNSTDAGKAGRASAPRPQAHEESEKPPRTPGTVREGSRGHGRERPRLRRQYDHRAGQRLWNAKEKIILHQMKGHGLYKGSEGHAPQDSRGVQGQNHQREQLQLPSLPAGHHYVYDPSTEELMVERPNNP